MCDLYSNLEEVDRVVLSGHYGTRYFEISTFRGHPNAYVSFPEGAFIKDFRYDKFELPKNTVHEGLTAFGIRSGMLMLGWDYDHLYDYNAADHREGKKWDIPQIIAEIVALIDFLNTEFKPI